MDVQALFNKFAGQEVPVKAVIDGEKYEEWALVNDKDPVLQEMFDVATKSGLFVRVWLPDSFGTEEYRTDRLNVYIEPDSKGKWTVSDRFTIG